MAPTSLKLASFVALVLLEGGDAWTIPSRSSQNGFVSSSRRTTTASTVLYASDSNDTADNNNNSDVQSIDVSDLGITMEDLEKPLPPEMLQGMALQGVESTSRIPTDQDDGCLWTEHSNTLDVTLVIPGLRGQPAAALAVTFSTTTATVSAFGRAVWSCVLKGEVIPESATFVTEDGVDMIPVISLTVQKADKSARWGGFIEQIGEDSIL